jgi:hypothetical protein
LLGYCRHGPVVSAANRVPSPLGGAIGHIGSRSSPPIAQGTAVPAEAEWERSAQRANLISFQSSIANQPSSPDGTLFPRPVRPAPAYSCLNPWALFHDQMAAPQRVMTDQRSLNHAQTVSPAFCFSNAGRVVLYQRSGVGQLRSRIAPQLCGILRVELWSVVRLPIWVSSRLECTWVRPQLIAASIPYGGLRIGRGPPSNRRAGHLVGESLDDPSLPSPSRRAVVRNPSHYRPEQRRATMDKFG